MLILAQCQMWISIHALVKRATSPEKMRQIACDISIHALVKRATRYGHVVYPGWVISIHALVKRATSTAASSAVAKRYFNPRPREEGDYESVFLVLNIQRFQSTPS